MRLFTQRHGTSILELMCVLSISSTIMLVAMTWLHFSMKFASTVKGRQSHDQTLTRLGWTFRDDVGASQSLTLKPNNQLVLKEPDGSETVYSISDTSVIVERKGLDGKIDQYDRFDLAPGSIVRWDDSEGPDWITLIVSRRPIGPQTERETPPTDASDKRSAATELHIRTRSQRWSLADDVPAAKPSAPVRPSNGSHPTDQEEEKQEGDQP